MSHCPPWFTYGLKPALCPGFRTSRTVGAVECGAAAASLLSLRPAEANRPSGARELVPPSAVSRVPSAHSALLPESSHPNPGSESCRGGVLTRFY